MSPPRIAFHPVILSVELLRKTFVRGFFRRKTQALRGVTFGVEQGEIFGFLGPNGAGKTTTIKILMGLICATSGKAELFGAPVGRRDARERVGYLPENPYFYDHLTATELLDLVARLHRLERAHARRRTAELLERMDLVEAAKRPLRSFSKGMLQRVGLAQALLADPDLLVLDEPMSGLDPLGRKAVRDLILSERERGKTVFFSTHILADATLLCDRVAILVRGELRDVGPLGTLLSPKVQLVDLVWNPGPESRLDDPALAGFPGPHSRTSEGHLYRAPDLETAQRFVATVVRDGSTIVSFLPQRQTLEELFVAEASSATPAARGVALP